MSLRIVTDVHNIDHKQWQQFVHNHPLGNVFQSPQMYVFYNTTEKYQPIAVACYKEDSLMGILLAVVQKEHKGRLGELSARSIIWGGPLVKNNDLHVLDAIMKEYDLKIKKQAIYTQIRNIFSMDWAAAALRQRGYRHEEHLDILINLKRPEEEIWKDLHPTRRKQIERGYRRGVQFQFVALPSDAILSECYELILATYKNIKLPIPRMDFFKNAMELLPNHIALFCLTYQEKIIGCRFVLLYKKMIYDWYAGSDSIFLDKYPNDILPWEVMKWGAENGYEAFDFGGAGKPGVPYGVRDFKLKFGGELVNFGRLEKVHQPVRMAIAKSGFKVWRLLKK